MGLREAGIVVWEPLCLGCVALDGLGGVVLPT